VDAGEIGARLEALVRPYHLPEGEIEEHAERLAPLPADAQRRVLELVGVLWPVSHALTFSFLRNAAEGLAVFGETRLQIWVGAILDAYEAGGLEQASPILADGGRAFVRELRGEQGVRYRDVVGRLYPYLCALAGHHVEVAEGREAATDTAVVWLPGRIAVFEDPASNFLLYKLAAALQWGHIAAGTYRAELPAGHPLVPGLESRFGTVWAGQPAWLVNFFGLFPDPALAQRIYQTAATARVAALLAAELPGLARAAAPVLGEYFSRRARAPDPGARERFFESIRRWSWGVHGSDEDPPAGAIALLAPLREPGAPPVDALPAVAGLYPIVAVLGEGDAPAELPPFEGILQPSLAEERRRARREEAREQFIEAFRALVDPGAGAERERRGVGEADRDRPEEIAREDGGAAVARDDVTGELRADRAAPEFIRIGAQRIEISEELRPLVEEIRRDLGSVPSSYVSGVIARAGRAAGRFAGPAVPEGPRAREALVYDEWDFRRAGFRKGWCSVHLLELEPGDPEFVARTLRRYRGALLRIRRAFEMLRTGERFVRRQRDGDEVDIDALIEARSDLAAGLAASDRLFIRLVRDVRDIAVVFLVDQSSSTEGWVNSAIKESLALLCDSLEVLGDRYAVLGFSGMKRLRSEVYRIKDLDEPYGPEVKGRIAAIAPRDYTRMGPPIRHATALLRAAEAKSRLLVILSDGKPEDYDEYKGDYAIEDTRHALIEAKLAGVHPFGITLDAQAHDYVAHLFGDVNYVVIDDVARLPLRVPEIYRTLTT
jgi:nitric oxide reductase NorD protein